MVQLPPRSPLFPYTTLFRSLDADSAYADVALHANGLTSLQYREEKGAATHEIQANVSAPKRLRIVKHGAYFSMWRADGSRSEEHTSELQSLRHLVCRLLLEK